MASEAKETGENKAYGALITNIMVVVVVQW